MGDRIRARRVEKKLSQAELGEAVQLGKGMISAIEKGRYMPSVPALKKIGLTLGCGVDVLLYGAGVARTYQASLPGMTPEERIQALPRPLREEVLATMATAEAVAATLQKMAMDLNLVRDPSLHKNWATFCQRLTDLSETLETKDPEK